MKNMIINYKIKAENLEQNKQYIEKVFSELQASSPEPFQYASLLLEDNVSFVHIVYFDENIDFQMQDLPAFKAFIKDIDDRCDDKPQANSANIIGNYRLFSA